MEQQLTTLLKKRLEKKPHMTAIDREFDPVYKISISVDGKPWKVIGFSVPSHAKIRRYFYTRKYVVFNTENTNAYFNSRQGCEDWLVNRYLYGA